MDLFDVAIAASTTRIVEFQKAWRAGNGSYGPLATMVFKDQTNGDVLSTISPDGERVMIVVTPFGNVIVVEMDRDSRTVVVHAAPEMQGIWGRGRLNDDQIEAVLGLWGKDNIGTVLNRLISYEQRKVA